MYKVTENSLSYGIGVAHALEVLEELTELTLWEVLKEKSTGNPEGVFLAVADIFFPDCKYMFNEEGEPSQITDDMDESLAEEFELV